MIDPVALTADLIRCPSVTPEEGGALDLLERLLTAHGFACRRIPRGDVDNLYARRGTEGPVLAFAGHTDVVPTGDPANWHFGPFEAMAEDGILYGRGAVDMKSGVAAFVAAVLAEPDLPGSVSLIIAGDEEGEARDGTLAILDWMESAGESADLCIVGEPTSVARVGDTVKIGRRGSMTGYLTVAGVQGHSAYPDRAVNPLPALTRACLRLAETPLDLGSTHFQASTLALTSIDVGNPANNVIPAAGRAVFNIRFNDTHSSDSLKAWASAIVEAALEGTGCTAEITWKVSGESFLTEPSAATEAVTLAITDTLLEEPVLSTGGGTSDARFIKRLCPVVEFGLVGDTMHAVDERVPVEDIRTLAELYRAIIRRFFAV